MKLNKREMILIAILILAALAMIFSRYAYTPGRNKLTELEAELETNKTTLLELKVRNKQAAKVLQEIKNIDNEIRALEKKLTAARDIPATLVEFYEMLTDNRLAGDTITFSDITQAEKYDFFTVSFNGRGKREDIDSFLRRLENKKAEISISEISLSSTGGADFEMNISVAIYMFKTNGKREYLPDYALMEEGGGVYVSWYEMFKSLQLNDIIDIDTSGGVDGARNQ